LVKCGVLIKKSFDEPVRQLAVCQEMEWSDIFNGLKISQALVGPTRPLCHP